MNDLRRLFVLGLAAFPLVARADAPVDRAAKRRLGVIYFADQKTIDSIPYDPKPLAAYGWVLGRNLEKVRRFCDGDNARFEPLARALVAERCDVLLAAGVACTRAMQKATRTIPICAIVDDPVGNGFARSMARPGGNITGLCEGYAESAEKQIALLRTVMPGLSRMAIVTTGRDLQALKDNSQWLVKAITAAGIAVDMHAPESRAQVETIIKAMPAGKGALYLRWVHPKEVESIARLANPRRVALVGQDEEDVAHGALMSYSPVVAEDHLLNAMLDRLLRGGNPAQIPFELPTRATFVINRKAAAAIGVRFPPEFTVMANRIVD